MAFDPAPATHIANWAEDGTDITVPIASFPELTAAEADAVTGDIRKVAFALCSKLYALHAAMATADKPTKFTVAQSRSFSGNNINHAFTFNFVTSASGVEVVAES